MEERLQKVLASAGVASRREAEKYILAGRVKVNGKIVKELGTKVGEKAFILVDGKPIKREKKAYYLFYKPRGVVTTMTDPQGRRTVADFAKDFDDFHDWQNQLLYDFAKADTDVVLAGNFIFFRFSKEQKEKWFSNKYEEFSKIVATVTAENFHEFATINKLQETISSSDSIVSYVMDGMSDIHRFDDMIRMIDSNEWYVIENAIKLSFDEEK